MKIEDIISKERPPQLIIDDLKRKTTAVPAWSTLEKEYNTEQHPVITDPNYKDKPRKTGGSEKMTRFTVGWIKLAVKRIASLLFGIPVLRVYNDHDHDD